MKSYPKILQMHHLSHFTNKTMDEIYWIVEEKVDGSLFRVKVKDEKISMSSKGQDLILDDVEVNAIGMFRKAVDYVLSNKDRFLGFDDHTFYFEYLQKPRQNTLTYDRTPTNNLVLFDVRIGEIFIDPLVKAGDMTVIEFYASRLNVDPINIIGVEKDLNIDKLNNIIKNNISYLGGSTIEGVVIKSYVDRRNKDPYFNEPLMVKWVREDFKEINKENNRDPSKHDIVAIIEGKYKTVARWEKAVNHCREKGFVNYELQDLKYLLSEVVNDTFEEEGENIKNDIFKFYEKEIKRKLIRGFPDWYKEYLAKRSDA